MTGFGKAASVVAAQESNQEFDDVLVLAVPHDHEIVHDNARIILRNIVLESNQEV